MCCLWATGSVNWPLIKVVNVEKERRRRGRGVNGASAAARRRLLLWNSTVCSLSSSHYIDDRMQIVTAGGADTSGRRGARVANLCSKRFALLLSLLLSALEDALRETKKKAQTFSAFDSTILAITTHFGETIVLRCVV